MSERNGREGRWPAVTALGAGAVSAATGCAVLALHTAQGPEWSARVDPLWQSVVVWTVLVGGFGGVLAWRRPDHPFGWLAVAAGWTTGGSEVALVAAELAHGGAERYLTWVGAWVWLPGYAVLATVGLTLLPDGRPVTPAWRGIVRAQAAVVVLVTVVEAVTPFSELGAPFDASTLTNPFAVEWAGGLRVLGQCLVVAAALAGMLSLLVRIRRSRDAGRRRLLPILVGAALTVLVALSAIAVPESWEPWVVAASVVPLVAGTGLAVLQGEVVGADAAIGRSVAYATLTLVVLAGYLAVVGAAGTYAGGATALVAVVLVGLTLHPLHRSLQRLVNRLLYGRRDDPAEVLAAFGQRLEGMGSAEPGGEALPGLSRTLAEALRLPYVAVTVADEVVSAHGEPGSVVASEPLVHRGETVGELHLSPRRGEAAVGPADRRVLAGLRPALAAAVHSLRMTRDVLRSREAIAEARDAERERLHRNLHDDVGPTLAALVMQLDLARELVTTDPGAAEQLLDRIKSGVTGVVDSTRRIVHDLGPRDLDDGSLGDALAEVVDRFSAAPVAISAQIADPGSLSEEVETTILRATAEALTNVVRHSRASTCSVSLARENGTVRLVVADDGVGLTGSEPPGLGLRSLRQRAAELGGRCEITGGGPGTRVALELPVHAATPARVEEPA